MDGISFGYLVFNLLNNLIWLAYANKVNDRNIGIPSFIGKYTFDKLAYFKMMLNL